MIVACPYCNTTYNLPDDKARPEAKLRCTVCKHMFSLAESVEAQERLALEKAALEKISRAAAADKEWEERNRPLGDGLSISLGEAKHTSKWPLVVVLVVVLLTFGTLFAWKKTTLLNPLKVLLGVELPLTPEERAALQAERIRQLVGSIGLRNVRQYYVNNDKIGKIMAIEGQVVNEFDEPRELIVVEANLYDADNTLLVSKSLRAGTMVSFFQLQVLDESELEQALTNNLDIISNNTNVQPGATVPFMVVFYNPPETATNFDIRVVGAQVPAPRQPQQAAQ